MNVGFFFISLFAGIAGVLIGYCLLPFFAFLDLPLIFSAFDIAMHNKKEWATAATWFGSFGTWFAAIFTAFTLIFLICQNVKLRKEQEEAKRRQENADEKQQNMWDKQAEIIAFQKYQMHVQSFNSMLDDLENSYPITFFNRHDLYQKIFHGNDFSSCNLKPKITDDFSEQKTGNLNDIRYTVNQLKNDLESLSHKNVGAGAWTDTADFLKALLFLTSKLHININKKRETGDILFVIDSNNYFLLNVFEPNKTINLIEAVVNRLIGFSGGKEYHHFKITHLSDLSLEHLLFMAFGGIGDMHHAHKVHIDESLKRYLPTLYELRERLMKLNYADLDGFLELSYVRMNLEFLFYSKEEILILSGSMTNMYLLFCDIRNALAVYENEGGEDKKIIDFLPYFRQTAIELKRIKNRSESVLAGQELSEKV